MHVYIYIYIYVERERYNTYVYIYIYREREIYTYWASGAFAMPWAAVAQEAGPDKRESPQADPAPRRKYFLLWHPTIVCCLYISRCHVMCLFVLLWHRTVMRRVDRAPSSGLRSARQTRLLFGAPRYAPLCRAHRAPRRPSDKSTSPRPSLEAHVHTLRSLTCTRNTRLTPQLLFLPLRSLRPEPRPLST